MTVLNMIDLPAGSCVRNSYFEHRRANGGVYIGITLQPNGSSERMRFMRRVLYYACEVINLLG